MLGTLIEHFGTEIKSVFGKGYIFDKDNQFFSEGLLGFRGSRPFQKESGFVQNSRGLSQGSLFQLEAIQRTH